MMTAAVQVGVRSLFMRFTPACIRHLTTNMKMDCKCKCIVYYVVVVVVCQLFLCMLLVE